MLHASSSTNSSVNSTPASSFFARLHSQRSQSFDDGQVEESPQEVSLQKSTSLRTPGSHGPSSSRLVDSRRDVAALSSFTAAGSTLDSPTPSNASVYTPPLASRHALFSHHAQPPPLSTSMSYLSDPGPPSPTGSNVSSGAFSPASAFLSHFSSTSSLRPSVNVAPDAQGAVVLEYTLGKLLGRGGFSAVRQAIHSRTGEIMACKIVKRDDLSDRSGSLERFEDEIRIWKSMPRHESLLPLLEMHRTPFATFLITPFLPGGSLLDVLRREMGSEKTARKWFPGVVAAVAAMHHGFPESKGGLLHGDLKLDNFLVDNHGHVMVADFGMTQQIGPGQEPAPSIPPPMVSRHSTLPSHFNNHRPMRVMSTNVTSHSPSPHRHHRKSSMNQEHSPSAQPFPSASLPYAPPELLRAPPSGPSLAQDIWALGVILHALLTGKLPFVDAFDPRLQMKILRGTYDEPTHLGQEWLDCLRGCLNGDRLQRWDIQQVQECDAVVGWRQVKPRSKSRSRSRVGRGAVPVGLGLGHHQTQPVAIVSSTPRSGRSLSRGEPSPFVVRGQTFPADPFAFTSPPVEARSRAASVSHSRSDSQSRSRSSGNRSVFHFESIERDEEERGRGRRPPVALQRSMGFSGRDSTTHLPYSAPPFHDPMFPPDSLPSVSPVTARSSSASLSPVSTRGRSTSRSRGTSKSRSPWTGLDVVDEEGRGRRSRSKGKF